MLKSYHTRIARNIRSIEMRLLLFMEKRLSIIEGWFNASRKPGRYRWNGDEHSFLEIRAERGKAIAAHLQKGDPLSAPIMRPQRVKMEEYYRHMRCKIVKIAPEDVDAVCARMKQRAHDEGSLYFESSRESGFGSSFLNHLKAPTELLRGRTEPPVYRDDSQNQVESVHDALARFGFYPGKPRYLN